MPRSHRQPAATTRAEILAAARVRFSTDGYERTTVRAVAADVGLDPALVIRHFGSKEALFRAAAELRLQLPDLDGVPPDELASRLMPHFFAVWEHDGTFLALMRAAISNETAAQQMREVFIREVAPALAVAVPDHPAERAALVGSQILGLAVSRYVLRTPPLTEMSQAELVHWITPVLRLLLTGPYRPPAPSQVD